MIWGYPCFWKHPDDGTCIMVFNGGFTLHSAFRMVKTVKKSMSWIYPPPRMPVASEGLCQNHVILVVTGILGGGVDPIHVKH